MPTLSHPTATLPVAKDTPLSDPRPWTPSMEVAVGTPVPPPALLAHQAVGGNLGMKYELLSEPEPMDHLEPLVERAPSPEPDHLELGMRHEPTPELEAGMRQESSQEPDPESEPSLEPDQPEPESEPSLEPDHQEPESRHEPSPEPDDLQTDTRQESSPEPTQVDAASSISSSYQGDDSGVSCDGLTPGVTPIHMRRKVELDSIEYS